MQRVRHCCAVAPGAGQVLTTSHQAPRIGSAPLFASADLCGPHTTASRLVFPHNSVTMARWRRHNQEDQVLHAVVTQLMRDHWRHGTTIAWLEIQNLTSNLQRRLARQYIEELMSLTMMMTNFATPRRYALLDDAQPLSLQEMPAITIAAPVVVLRAMLVHDFCHATLTLFRALGLGEPAAFITSLVRAKHRLLESVRHSNFEGA